MFLTFEICRSDALAPQLSLPQNSNFTAWFESPEVIPRIVSDPDVMRAVGRPGITSCLLVIPEPGDGFCHSSIETKFVRS